MTIMKYNVSRENYLRITWISKGVPKLLPHKVRYVRFAKFGLVRKGAKGPDGKWLNL